MREQSCTASVRHCVTSADQTRQHPLSCCSPNIPPTEAVRLSMKATSRWWSLLCRNSLVQRQFCRLRQQGCYGWVALPKTPHSKKLFFSWVCDQLFSVLICLKRDVDYSFFVPLKLELTNSKSWTWLQILLRLKRDQKGKISSLALL